MNNTKIARAFFSVIKPAVWALAQRLFLLTQDRPGSAKHRPTVATFYETGIVLSIYEHLLMLPEFSGYDIRYENAYITGKKGAPPRVDLWMRPANGGYPYLIEVGDFGVSKIHNDLKKMQGLSPAGKHWFLALFRKPGAYVAGAVGNEEVADAKSIIDKSLSRKNGLDSDLVDYSDKFIEKFEVYRPDGSHDWFGVALLEAKP